MLLWSFCLGLTCCNAQQECPICGAHCSCSSGQHRQQGTCSKHTCRAEYNKDAATHAGPCQSAGGRSRWGGLCSRCGSNCGLNLSIACAIQPHGLRPEGRVVGGEGNHTLAVAHKALGPRLAGRCMHRNALKPLRCDESWRQWLQLGVKV